VQLGPLIPMLFAVGWLFYKEQNTTGTIFLVWSLAIGLIDNFLRPILIRRGADLPFLLIFSGVVGGLLAFGVMGLFIGPVILAITYTLGNSWMDEADEQDWPEVPKSYRTDTDQIYPEI
jgi:predicted PurR-regulated permease PerM